MRHLVRRGSATPSRSTFARVAVRLPLLILLLLAAGVVCAAPAFSAGAVGGHVFNQAGQPIELVNVGVYVSTDGGATYGLVAHAATDASGAYLVTTSLAGFYKVQFADDLHRFVWEWWNDRIDWQQADSFFMGPDAVRTDVNAVLEPSGRASGIVTDTEGAPLENIRIDGFRWSEPIPGMGGHDPELQRGDRRMVGGRPPSRPVPLPLP